MEFNSAFKGLKISTQYNASQTITKNSDAEELPRRKKHTTFTTWRKFEIKNNKKVEYNAK
jgi:hypothetical protein